MKKGQAAMEFLMTYGWAILVVLVAIGALAYFGVLSPSRFLPSSCTLIPGLSCDEFKIDPDGSTGADATMIVRNGMGESLVNVSLMLVGDSSDGACTGSYSNNVTTFADGSTETFTIDCSVAGEPSGSRFKSDITIGYISGSLTHSSTGSITAQVE